METKRIITGNVDSCEFGYWDEESQNFITIESITKKVIRKTGLSKEAIDLIMVNFSNLKEAMTADLADIWKRLDNK